MHHPRVIIVHRVNDSGYQRRNGLMTNLMTLCSNSSDYLVYNSIWIKNQMLPKLKSPLPSSVILNGNDLKISNLSSRIPWDGKSKLKIVTHHWSSNHDKGHDFYQAFDKLLDYEDFKNKYEFTYIGNYPTNLEYRNTKLIPVMSKNELMKELSKHHIYLTGSKNEAAGYHVIEGISLGLPVLYYDSGGVPEYSRDCGLKFTDSNFERQLNKMRQEYFNFFTSC
jgi:glycosyltransferase involved in cell wall biosynthesis